MLFKDDNGINDYCAIGAIHHYIFGDDDKIPREPSNDDMHSLLCELLYDYILNANDSEDSNHSFGEIAQNIINHYR
jgi:hypothetical protein